MVYQLLPQGTFQVVKGNLGSDPSIEEISGKKVVKLNIATPGSSKKNNEGKWENTTVWRSFTFWSGSAAVDGLIAHIEETQAKEGFVRFSKGNTVELYVISSSKITESNGKHYINEDNPQLLHLFKVLSGRSNNNGEGAESPKQETKVETLANVVDEIPIPADWQ